MNFSFISNRRVNIALKVKQALVVLLAVICKTKEG